MKSYDRKMCLEICKDVCATDDATKTVKRLKRSVGKKKNRDIL